MAGLLVVLVVAVALVAGGRAVAASDSGVVQLVSALVRATWWVVRFVALLWWRTLWFVVTEVTSW
jgi:hypothetical protein